MRKDDHITERIVYGSDDAGKNFRRIIASDSPATCKFAATKGSRVKDDGICCIEAIEESKDNEARPSNQTNIESRETPFRKQRKLMHTLFYTTDLGKTKMTFDDLNGFSVEQIFILPSSVAVVTTDSNNSLRHERLWFSSDGLFKSARLPDDAVFLSTWGLYEDDQGQLLLSAIVGKDECSGSGRLFISISLSWNLHGGHLIWHRWLI